MSSTLFTPYKLGPVTLRNRTIRSAAFESMGKDFGPTRQLKDYHVAVARGGVGMTTLAYAAVCRSGLSFNKQLWLRPEIVPGLREITDAVHREGAAAAIQIGHCGNMTHWTTAGQMPIGASTGFNLYAYTPVRGMKRREIEQVARDFGTAVRTARDAGFDSVEVHAGHGYLISQFLSPYTNHRHDEYGGSLENRMRFMRMCLGEAVEAARACGMAITVKHNMYDGFKGGIEIPESIEIAKVIESFGVDGIVLSGGFVSKAPMAVMRGLIPIYTMSYYSPLWLRYFIRWCGPFMIKQFPFEECYFLEDAKKFRAALKGPLIYVGGLVSREGIDRALDSGFELVQMARALVNDPAFVAKLREGDAATRSACDLHRADVLRRHEVLQALRQPPATDRRRTQTPAVMKREAITPCGEHTAAVSGSGRSVGRRGAVAPGSAWALVTGAGSGIGRCYALRLAALGYNLVLAGNRREPLETVCGEILAAGAGPDGGVRKAASPAAGFRPEVRIVEIDLARIEAAAELWEAVRREGAAIDVLVNNAGIFSFRDILQTPAERIERIILLHDLTNTQLCRMAAADMVRRGCRGHILNMSSYSLWMPFPGLALYSASKAYLRSFSVAFAKEVREHGIRVTAVCPAGVATDLYGLTPRWQRIGTRLGVLITADSCARRGLRALWRGRRCIVPDWWNRVWIPLCKILPMWVLRPVRRFTMKFQK